MVVKTVLAGHLSTPEQVKRFDTAPAALTAARHTYRAAAGHRPGGISPLSGHALHPRRHLAQRHPVCLRPHPGHRAVPDLPDAPRGGLRDRIEKAGLRDRSSGRSQSSWGIPGAGDGSSIGTRFLPLAGGILPSDSDDDGAGLGRRRAHPQSEHPPPRPEAVQHYDRVLGPRLGDRHRSGPRDR